MIKEIDQRHFETDLLPSNALVFDAGALHGTFARELAAMGHRVMAFEPDPSGINTIPKTSQITPVQKGLIGQPLCRSPFINIFPVMEQMDCISMNRKMLHIKGP